MDEGMNGQMYRCMTGWIGEGMNEQIYEWWMDGWMDGCMNEWMYVSLDGWMKRRTLYHRNLPEKEYQDVEK